MVQNAVTYKRKKPQTIKKTPRIIKVIEKLVPLLCALPYIYALAVPLPHRGAVAPGYCLRNGRRVPCTLQTLAAAMSEVQCGWAVSEVQCNVGGAVSEVQVLQQAGCLQSCACSIEPVRLTGPGPQSTRAPGPKAYGPRAPGPQSTRAPPRPNCCRPI